MPNMSALELLDIMCHGLNRLPLTRVGLAGDMTMFSFGRDHVVTTREGATYCADYALHVQCGWQLANQTSIVAGYLDILDEVGLDDPTGEASPSLLASRIRSIGRELTDTLTVANVESGPWYRLSLVLSQGYRLDVLPMWSTRHASSEYWRLMEVAGEERHVVATPAGLEVS